MKSRLTIAWVIVMVIFTSCGKEEITNQSNAALEQGSNEATYGKTQAARPYYESFTAISNITPTANGVFNPGWGTGSARHMGTAKMCFNQQVIFAMINSQPMPIGSTAAPVNQFYASQLAAAGITVPNSVSSITYDDFGNSVWFTSTTGTSLAPVSATRVNFTANLQIIGGTGRFAGASGTTLMNGYFNPQDPNQAAVISTGGTIIY
ncbi:MAG: hypothetical protein WC760_09790 [Bacteroidia bacterium]|jgi:hypothetical protein